MGASYAFSPIGWQGITCGVGNTEDCRFSTSMKYPVDIGQFRVATLWQFGGYDLNNAATGAYQLQIGGGICNLAGGPLLPAPLRPHVPDTPSIGAAPTTPPGGLSPGLLSARVRHFVRLIVVD